MFNCPNCGAPIDLNNDHCVYCGTPYGYVHDWQQQELERLKTQLSEKELALRQ